jgi:hypothetical protein
MKKAFLVLLAIFFTASIACAKPFLTCDPQAGITKYKIETPIQAGIVAHWEIVVDAEPDGSLKWDLQNWPHGKGTFTGNLYAGGDWQVTDSTTGIVTTVFDYSIPSAFAIKVPSYKVTGIGGR